MSVKNKHCPNCSYQLTRYHNYCPNCGQKVDDKLNMRVLFHNTVMNYFSVDARFFRSFIPLLTRPGYLAKKFVSGKRLMYLHPAQFYLFASIVFFFIFSISISATKEEFEDGLRASIGREKKIRSKAQKIYDSIRDVLEQDLLKTEGKDSLAIQKLTYYLKNGQLPTQDSISKDSTKVKKQKRPSKGKEVNEIFGLEFDTTKIDSLHAAGASMDEKLKAVGHKESDGWFAKFLRKQIIKFRQKMGDGILEVFLDTIPISMFFLIPIFALLLKLFYRKRGRFAHHMVFSFYFFAFIFLASSIIITTNLIVEIPDWIDITLLVSMLIYLYLSLKHFYEQGYFKTFFKTLFLTFIYLIFVIPLTFAILSVVSFLLY
ncbi:DUF3667 domain-containing protein [uncultured Kordia sp.]|uniref:DUF3667 domain-containing protein n=1 Tax=uncultured Kordia sp. TaxID=507699 RepID=UPI0026073C9E|nr:DUF3667 domain-containing protein [uncultured Kordia sp.]